MSHVLHLFNVCDNFFAQQVRSAVAELKNAVRVFGQLSAAANLHFHGFDEKKIDTHVEYCKHLLEAAKVHCEAAQREEEQVRQRQELARQIVLAEEARIKAEEQTKKQVYIFCRFICSFLIQQNVAHRFLSPFTETVGEEKA